jgi:hypothetical protein
MYGKKTLIAAAALAVMGAAGLGPAAAAPWEHRVNRIEHRKDRIDRRLDRRVDRIEHRHYADRIAIEHALRGHHYRVIGTPYFVRGHYVVRSHDRFGRTVLVRIDPYSGAFLGVFRL